MGMMLIIISIMLVMMSTLCLLVIDVIGEGNKMLKEVLFSIIFTVCFVLSPICFSIGAYIKLVLNH